MTNSLQWIVVGFGILVGLAGLIAFFVSKEEGSNRMKLFGGEVELSRPALVVFVAGCVIVVASLYLSARQPVEEKSGGTESALANDRLAHDMRFSAKPIKLSPEQCLNEAKKALRAGAFSLSKAEGDFAHGFAKEYNGVVWCLPSSWLVFFIVSGPDWRVADAKRTMMERGFSIE